MKCMFRFLLMCSLFSSALNTSTGSDVPRLSCAQGAVLAALAAHGIDANSNAVVAAFPDDFRATDAATPMSVVCEVLNTFGLEASAVRFDVSSPSRDWESCILLLNADPNDPGHFVWLKSLLRNDEVVLVDPRNTIGEHVLSMQQLAEYWRGHAIDIKSSGVGDLSWYVTPLLFSLTAVMLINEWAQRRNRRANITALLFLVIVSGCGNPEQRSLSSVEFRNRRVELTNLKEGEIQQIYLPIEILENNVEIAAIEASCSCASVDKELVGKSLSKGDSCSVSVTVDPGTKDEIAFDVLVQTTGGDATRANLAGIVEQSPRANVPVVMNEYTANVSNELSGTLTIQRSKSKDVTPLKPQSTVVEGNNVKLSYLASTDDNLRRSRAGGEIVIEESKWNWTAVPVDGKFRDEEVVISLGSHEIPISFKFVEVPPLRGLPLSIYCGKLLPGQEWKREFKLSTTPSRHVVGIHSDASGAKAEISDVTASQNQIVRFTMNAPVKLGKFSEYLQLEIEGVDKPFLIEAMGEVVSKAE